MKKKKNKAGKKKTLLGGAAKSLKKLGGSIGGLSTTQKVVGGTALVALGLSYVAKRRAPASAPAPEAAGAEEILSGMEDSKG